jgi:hypothetical protein
MTYAELGMARGISAKSAERLVQRRRWPRQIGNDGIARVLVPLGEDRITPRHQPPMSAPVVGDRQGMMSSPDIGDVVREAIRDVVAPLSALLERAEQETATLRAELVELRMSEQAAANLAEYGTAQAVDLRKRLEAAEQRASDERDRADRGEKRADDEQGRADQERQRADRERERADRAAQQLAVVEVELVGARVEAAGLRCKVEQARKPPPKPEPPRTRWGRFKAWRRWS